MTFDPSKLVAVNYVTSTEIARQLNTGPSSADLLCRAGISGPVAITIAKQMAAGTGHVEALRQCGFCSSDATVLAAAITTAGAR
jgi:hypothetical protein